jgi:hypothetical protein
VYGVGNLSGLDKGYFIGGIYFIGKSSLFEVVSLNAMEA